MYVSSTSGLPQSTTAAFHGRSEPCRTLSEETLLVLELASAIALGEFGFYPSPRRDRDLAMMTS